MSLGPHPGIVDDDSVSRPFFCSETNTPIGHVEGLSTEITRHDNDRIGKIHRPAFAIGEQAIV